MNFQMRKKEKDKDYKEIEKLLKNVEKKRKKNNQHQNQKYICNLIIQLESLKNKNAELRGMIEKQADHQNKIGLQRVKLSQLKSLMSEENPPEKEIKDIMKTYYENWSEFGAVRNQQIIWHLNQLKKVLLPAQLTKMLIWSLQQDDDFYDVTLNNATHGGGIWDMLITTMNLTKEQQQKIINFRPAVKLQRKNLGDALTMMDTIADNVKEILDIMTNQMIKIMEVLSPAQQARFLVWADQNAAGLLNRK